MKTTAANQKELLHAFAAGAHGPLRSGPLFINMSGELMSYSEIIIRRDSRTRHFQVLPGRRSQTTNKHISSARKILLSEGWKELS